MQIEWSKEKEENNKKKSMHQVLFKKSVQTKIAKGCLWTALLATTRTEKKGWACRGCVATGL